MICASSHIYFVFVLKSLQTVKNVKTLSRIGTPYKTRINAALANFRTKKAVKEEISYKFIIIMIIPK